MSTPTHAINWFELPVLQFNRARAFYSEIFDYEMPERQMGENRMGFLPADPMSGGVGGAIVHGRAYQPAAYGPLLYLNGGDDLNTILKRVERAGGKVLQNKTHIGDEIGYFAIFADTEGNRVALHSRG